MNDRSGCRWENCTTTTPNTTAMTAWPSSLAVLLRPSERRRRILMRSSAAPTAPSPTVMPSTASPATDTDVTTTREAAKASTIPPMITTPPMVGVPIFSM